MSVKRQRKVLQAIIRFLVAELGRDGVLALLEEK